MGKFEDENVNFKPTQPLVDGKISIGQLKELQEWLYLRTDIDDNEKLKHIKNMENFELSLLVDIFGKDHVEYTPIWSMILENDIKNKSI